MSHANRLASFAVSVSEKLQGEEVLVLVDSSRCANETVDAIVAILTLKHGADSFGYNGWFVYAPNSSKMIVTLKGED